MTSKESEEPMLCSGEEGDEGRADDADEIDTLRDVHFVSIVRGYEELYMREHPCYNDRAHRLRVWDEIGAIMNQPAENCKKRWRILRQNYFRIKKRAESSVDEAEYWAGRATHERLMSFLDAPDSETDDSTGSDNMLRSDDDQVPSGTGQAAHAPAAGRQLAQPEHDDTVDFFVELGESIKDFPEGVKINVKRDVFKIIIDTEEMLYHNKLKGELLAHMNTFEEHE